MAESVLTEAEMQEYIEMAERDEWDPKRWAPDNQSCRQNAYVIHIDDDEAVILRRRAEDHGLPVGDYLDNLVATLLAAV